MSFLTTYFDIFHRNKPYFYVIFQKQQLAFGLDMFSPWTLNVKYKSPETTVVYYIQNTLVVQTSCINKNIFYCLVNRTLARIIFPIIFIVQ